MKWADEQVRTRIAEAINEAEQRTSGEIVCVVAPSSDSYELVPVLWAALIALTLPMVLYLLSEFDGFTIYTIQLLVFITIVLVLRHKATRYRVVPRSLAYRCCPRHAVDQFLSQDLHTTKNRTGVLIFISVAERYGEIIADDGIYSKISPTHWDTALDALLVHLNAGHIENGFVSAIKLSADALSEYFPISDDDEDELLNHLIILEGDDL